MKSKKGHHVEDLLSITLFAILGGVLAGQVKLGQIFFGFDIINLIFSVLLVFGIVAFASKNIRRSPFAMPVFLILTWKSFAISFYVHTYPDWVTPCNYLILAVAAVLLLSADKGKDLVNKNRLISCFAFLCLGFLIGWFDLNRIGSTGLILAGLGIGIYSNYDQRPKRRILLTLVYALVLPLILWTKPTSIFPSQKHYFDPVVFSEVTPFQQIDVTFWKGNYWYYFNRINHFSTIDPWLFYEPLVHPAMSMVDSLDKVLVIGGENGLAIKEVLKYPEVSKITLIPIDTSYLSIAQENKLFTSINGKSLKTSRLEVKSADVFYELDKLPERYDIIIMDLPDPIDVETNQYFTKECFSLCRQKLKEKGVLVVQSGSPYFATKAFKIINSTMQSVGLKTVQIHNQVMSAGEWGWTIARADELNMDSLLRVKTFEDVETVWLNQDGMRMMLSFGKSQVSEDYVEINSLDIPILFRYYNTGNWQLK